MTRFRFVNLVVAGALGLALTASHAAAAPINVALSANGGVAAESSDYDPFAYPASNAIDGILASFNHTNFQANAWWDVTFNNTYYVSSVTVYNRQDCCFERLSPFSVFLYDSDNNIVWSETGQNVSNVAPDSWSASPDVFADRLRVQLDVSDYLHLGEVDVEGELVNPNAIPEPTTLVLLGTGLLGAVRAGRRRRATKS